LGRPAGTDAWATAAYGSLAFSAGCLTVPALSQAAGVHSPCPIARDCDLLSRLPSPAMFGLPVAWVGLLSAAVLLGLLVWEARPRFSLAFAATAAFYAGLLQWQTWSRHSLVCVWCMGAACGLAACALFLLRARTCATSLRGASASFVLLASPLLSASWLSSRPIPSQRLAINSVNRAHITTLASTQGALVVFGSPLCPACRVEIPKAIDWSRRHRFRFVYRYVPRHGGGHERRLGVALKLAIEAGRRDLWEDLLVPQVSWDADRHVLEALGTTQAQLKQELRTAEQDYAVARGLKLQTIPAVVLCPPQQGCSLLSGLPKGS